MSGRSLPFICWDLGALKGVLAVWTDVGHLLQTVNTVGDETAAKPQAEETTAEGSDMLHDTGVSLDGGHHLLVTPRTHNLHGLRSKLQALSEHSY